MLPNAETIYPGIIVYRDVFKKEYNLDTRLESVLSKTQGKKHWNLAQTGYDTLNKDYRDAWDFKIKENQGGSLMLGNGTHVEPEDFTEEEFELRSIVKINTLMFTQITGTPTFAFYLQLDT